MGYDLTYTYIGSQRIVSKIGDFASYGSDPRRIQYAGSEADAISVDYAGKYSAQQEAIKENYATFEVPYNGTDNNDYVNGEGFCCDDGSMEAAQTRAMAKALEDNFQEGDAYENLQFYYHPDHLGSSSYITNLDGEVVQHVEYVPFGEVFIEERNNIWNTPYLFNAKEFDEETGLYYYGARYYDPRINLWVSVDPLSEMSSNYSPYRYGYNNPIRFIDVLGLFETKYQAKEYSDNMGINGRIQKNDDGTYSINDYNNHISYTAGDDSGNMLGDTHVHDGVVESLLVTNEKSPSYFWRVKDFSDNGFNLFSEYYYNKIPTSTKSKYVYETSKFLKQKTGIKIKGYSNIYRNVIPKTFRVIGNTSGVISLGKVGYDVINTHQVKGSNILDATIGTISFIPGWGWIAGGIYFGSDVMVTLFTGNSIGEHLDYYIDDNFDKNNGALLKW